MHLLAIALLMNVDKTQRAVAIEFVPRAEK